MARGIFHTTEHPAQCMNCRELVGRHRSLLGDGLGINQSVGGENVHCACLVSLGFCSPRSPLFITVINIVISVLVVSYYHILFPFSNLTVLKQFLTAWRSSFSDSSPHCGAGETVSEVALICRLGLNHGSRQQLPAHIETCTDTRRRVMSPKSDTTLYRHQAWADSGLCIPAGTLGCGGHAGPAGAGHHGTLLEALSCAPECCTTSRNSLPSSRKRLSSGRECSPAARAAAPPAGSSPK